MRTESDLRWTPEPGEILSVSDLVARARGLLENAFSWVWVEGEVTNARTPASGHAYFTLSDEHAQLRAVCFRSTLRLLHLTPEDGLRVMARGRLTVYEARGDIQLVVEDMEPQGEGLLRLELEARKRRLQAAGLFDADRKRPLPPLPSAVGVVTSATGAAIRDILQVLARRAPGVNVFVSPARVQGEGAAEELRAALALVASQPEVDVVILGRGGGSAEDLWAFNDEALVRAVAACPVPVISAVGHEVDVTLVDFAADMRAPTPSAAAELAVREWAIWSEQVRRAGRSLGLAFERRVADFRRTLERLDPAPYSPAARIDRVRIGLDRALEALAGVADRGLVRARSRVRGLEIHLERFSPMRSLEAAAERLTSLQDRLGTAVRGRAHERRRILSMREAQLQALSPLAVLGRGYAIARKRSGAVVRDARACTPGDDVDVTLAHGELQCKVSSIRNGGARE